MTLEKPTVDSHHPGTRSPYATTGVSEVWSAVFFSCSSVSDTVNSGGPGDFRNELRRSTCTVEGCHYGSAQGPV